jgi:signal transduction histidine kinase/streptogramin lyase
LNRIIFPDQALTDRRGLRVEQFHHEEERSSTIPSDTIAALAAARDGKLWIASPGGALSSLDIKSGVCVRHPRPAGAQPIQKLLPGADTSLWLVTSAGLERLEPETGRAQLFPLPPPQKLANVQIDSGGVLWVLTNSGSLLKFQNERFHTVYSSHGSPGGDRFGNVRSLTVGSRGTILAGMTGGSVMTVDPVSGRIAFLPVPAGKRNSSAVLTFLCQDRSGTLWAGTSGAGLFKFNPFKNKFQLLRRTGEPGGLPHQSVTAFTPFGRSATRVWVGTAGKGLCAYDVEEERFLSPAELPAAARRFAGSSLTALRTTGDTLWVGMRNGELWMLSGDMLTSIGIPRRFPPGFATNAILSLYVDNGEALWIGTPGGGLHRLGIRSGLLRSYPFLSASTMGLGPASIWAIHRDRSGVFWFGLAIGGLEAGLPGQDGSYHPLRTFEVDPQEQCSLNSRTVTAIHEGEDALWFGTYSGGLNRFADSCFTHFTVDDGLPGNLINGIAEDAGGGLWVSTNRGIARLDPSSGEVRSYDRSDGLQGDEFNLGAILRLPGGAILMGGVQGFNVLRPDSIPGSLIPPPVVLTRFSVHNVEYPLSGPVEELSSMSLSHDENSFAFEFVALDHTNPEKNRYAYMLEGLEREWTEAGSRRYARYTNLDPGEYRFRVRAANSDGVWNNTGHAVQIVIHPPFWRTWWFTTILGAAALFLVWVVYTSRVRSKVQKTLEMERIRTEEAERVRAETARDFHDEMGHRLTRITMLSETARLQLESGISQPLLRKNLETIGENARSLYQGTRDFLWALDPHHDTLYEVALRLKDFGEELFDGTDVSFETRGIEPELERVRLTMDLRRNLQLIFKEVLHNVLKHAGCRSAVLSAKIEGDAYMILVSDDGRGFDARRETSGSGLRSIRGRAARIRGELEITTSSSGTVVRFRGKIPHSGGLSEDHSTDTLR